MIVFAAFQLMFAIITPALISGSFADRTKFLSWSIFITVWTTIVYFPVAHWVSTSAPTAAEAAGSPVGVSRTSLVVRLFISMPARLLSHCAWCLASVSVFERIRCGRITCHSFCSAPVCCGSVGSVHAGSALAANNLAGIAFMNTQVATAAAPAPGWWWRRSGRPATSVGAASGAVAGLVAITPACAFLTPLTSILLGLLAGAVCALAVGLKYNLGYDDALDVVGVHLVGGIIGCLYLGFFSTDTINPRPPTGCSSAAARRYSVSRPWPPPSVFAYSFAVAFILGWVLTRPSDSGSPGRRGRRRRRQRTLNPPTSSTPSPAAAPFPPDTSGAHTGMRRRRNEADHGGDQRG